MTSTHTYENIKQDHSNTYQTSAQRRPFCSRSALLLSVLPFLFSCFPSHPRFCRFRSRFSCPRNLVECNPVTFRHCGKSLFLSSSSAHTTHEPKAWNSRNQQTQRCLEKKPTPASPSSVLCLLTGFRVLRSNCLFVRSLYFCPRPATIRPPGYLGAGTCFEQTFRNWLVVLATWSTCQVRPRRFQSGWCVCVTLANRLRIQRQKLQVRPEQRKNIRTDCLRATEVWICCVGPLRWVLASPHISVV